MARKTPSAKTITSRSLTISTANFCFDLTWRRVEMELPLPRERVYRSPGPDFAEILNRKQISQLLGPLDQPRVAADPVPVAPGPLAGPSQAEVCGQYRRVARWREEEEEQ
jgi:hypothetical protein